jgi:hypothetical protein
MEIMIYPIVVLNIILAISNAQVRPCATSQNESIQIHWSESKTVFSPACKWALTIRALGENGPAEVSIQGIKQGIPIGVHHPLFGLGRDAVIHWGDGDTLIVVEDMQFSDRYRLMLFDPLNSSQREEEALRINDLLGRDIERKLKSRENIIYFLPRFVAWTDSGLAISVGVTTVIGQSGPFTAHCFGYEIASAPVRIRRTLNAVELKERFGSTCQEWP